MSNISNKEAAKSAEIAISYIHRGIFHETIEKGLCNASFIASEIRHAAFIAEESPHLKAQILERIWRNLIDPGNLNFKA